MEHEADGDHGSEGELADNSNDGLEVEDSHSIRYLVENQHYGHECKDSTHIHCNHGLKDSPKYNDIA